MLVGSLLLVAGLAPPFAGTAAAATGKTSSDRTLAAASAANAERAALRDAIWRLERSLRHRLLAGSRRSGAAHAADWQPAELARRLGVLRRAARKVGGADGRELARKTRALEPLLHELELRERAISPLPASPWQPAERATRLDAGAGATCADAVPVGDGKLAAATARGAAGSGELWLRYTATAKGAVVVSTAGSDFDTTVDVFESCPGTGVQPVAHGDDEVGLQARAAFRAANGGTWWIRIGGWDGTAGAVALSVDGSATGFAGAITDESDAHGLYRYVDVWNAGGNYVTSASSTSNGNYFVAGLAPGTYYAATRPDWDLDGMLDELYDGIACAGGAPDGCSPTAGTPIHVQSGTVLNGIDFSLGHGATLTGRVRDAASGAVLPGMQVEVFGANGGLAAQAGTDEAGRFLVSGIAGGVAFVVASPSWSSHPEYRAELYDGIPCAAGCEVTTGTPIAVQVGQTTSGIEIALDRYGAISGTVTHVGDGAPVSFESVFVGGGPGPGVFADTDAAGRYTAGGLEAGTYFARTNVFGSYADELYDDLPCDAGCSLTSGTPIPVTLAHTTTGIDFALHRHAVISGVVTDEATAATVSAQVVVYDVSGDYVTDRFTSNGAYQISGLLPGTYYLVADAWPYRGELYDNLPCAASCDPTTGTPVTVALDDEATGIDFALTPLGKVAGTVTDASTHAPISAGVSVWNGAGQYMGGIFTGNGTYEVIGLPAGTYYVTAASTEYIGELYDDLPCPGGPPAGCDPATGTAVAVTLGATTSGVDFALTRLGSINGVVRAAANAQPIGNATVKVFNAAGTQVTSTQSNPDGTYRLRALAAGNYFVLADAFNFEASLYSGMPCPPASCNPTLGTPIAVSLGADVTGVDFNLVSSGVITGVVTSPTGSPMPSINVQLYDSNGDFQQGTLTDGQGRYHLTADQGSWYAVAYAGPPYVPELYSGIRCPNSCDVTTGTPIATTPGATTANIDFQVTAGRGILGQVTDHGHPLPGVAIDLWSSSGQHLDSTVTGPNGAYHFDPSAGTYYVSTDNGMGGLDELWNDVPCPLGPAYQGLCDPTTGTPVTVANWDSLVTGIDFALDGIQLFDNGFEPGGRGWSAKWPP